MPNIDNIFDRNNVKSPAQSGKFAFVGTFEDEMGEITFQAIADFSIVPDADQEFIAFFDAVYRYDKGDKDIPAADRTRYNRTYTDVVEAYDAFDHMFYLERAEARYEKDKHENVNLDLLDWVDTIL